MARMISFAGEFEIRFERIRREGELLVINAELGVWDSQIFFQPEDIGQILCLMFNRSALGYFVILPLAWLRRLLARLTRTPKGMGSGKGC